MSDAFVHMRVPASLKARWVRKSRAAGMRLTDWIVACIDAGKGKAMTRTEYTIVATDRSVDTRAAADACNRELMAAGETFDLRAVEEKMAECAACLRDALRIEAEEVEIEEE